MADLYKTPFFDGAMAQIKSQAKTGTGAASTPVPDQTGQGGAMTPVLPQPVTIAGNNAASEAMAQRQRTLSRAARTPTLVTGANASRTFDSYSATKSG